MFLQGLNNGQNPVALIKKHPVYTTLKKSLDAYVSYIFLRLGQKV